jgi:hypothetical protein
MEWNYPEKATAKQARHGNAAGTADRLRTGQKAALPKKGMNVKLHPVFWNHPREVQ